MKQLIIRATKQSHPLAPISINIQVLRRKISSSQRRGGENETGKMEVATTTTKST